MTVELSLENLLVWALQVLVIGSIGALLSAIFRIRHPRSHLRYCYLILALCVVLPFVQPWQHPVAPSVQVDSGQQPSQIVMTSNSEPQGREPISWRQVLMSIFVTGITARLCLLFVGIWQLRRYRTQGSVLYPPVQSAVFAQRLTKQEAIICVSADDVGPVTFGFLHPIILVPQSFLALDEEAQCGILTHELLHVKRKDWVISVLEEFLRACFWFQPAVWWLLSQTKLAREEVVDAEVVRLTSAREPYIDALLAMSGVNSARDLVPAFLRRRHLSQRMHLLLMENSMSKLRLVSSYAFMCLILAMAGWSTLASFPLMGYAQVQEPIPTDGAGITVDPGGIILHRRPIFYPWDAAQKHVEGTVFVRLTLSSKGEVVDAQVLSGPEELRKDVIQSVLEWHYAADVSGLRTAQVRVDFRASAPVAAQQQPPVVSTKGILETIDVSELPEKLRTEVWQRVRAFKGQAFSDTLMNRIEAVVSGADSHLALRWGSTEDKNHTLKFVLSSTIPAVSVTQPEPPAPQPAIVEPQPAAPPVVRVGGGVSAPTVLSSRLGSTTPGIYRVGNGVSGPRVIHKVEPIYSDEARAARYQGTVVLEAIIQKDGSVEIARVVRSIGFGLDEKAIEAVSQWRFEPAKLNGEPVSVALNIEVNFNLR